MEITDKQKKRLLQLAEVIDEGDLALLKNFVELEEKVENMAEISKGEKGDKGDQGEQGESVTGPQGPKGDKGDSIVGPEGPAGKDGESIIGPKGEDGKDGSPDTGEQIIEKINEAEGLIKKERVDGLEELEKKLEKKISSIPRGGNRSSHSIKFKTLIADSSTKIFSVPKSITAIVLMSDFPHILFENSGFTINATRTQITLTVENAPSSGSQLLYQYSEVFNT